MTRRTGFGAEPPKISEVSFDGRWPLKRPCRRYAGTAQWGGYLPLAFGVSTVRYPILERTFDYVSTVQSVTDETCQILTFTAHEVVSRLPSRLRALTPASA